MDKKNRNTIKLCLKLIFTGLALWLVYNKIDIKALAVVWQRADTFYFIPALLAFVTAQCISSFRLLNFFKNIQLDLPVLYNIRLYLQGMFYNIFLPGGIGGDGYKILTLHKRSGINYKLIFSAVFFDRLSGLWAIGFLTVFLSMDVEMFKHYRYLILLAFITATVLYYCITWRFFKIHHRRFLISHLLAILVQSFQLACVLSIIAAFNYGGSALPYLFVFLISSLATLFPFSIGGLGAREIVMVWGATALLLDKDLSVAISLSFYIISAIVSLSGAIILFWKNKNASLPTPHNG